MKKSGAIKVGAVRSGVGTRQEKTSSTAELHLLAQKTERQLRVIQRQMRQRLRAEFARGDLTGPQRLVMSALVRSEGLSLKQLSTDVSLAHSTVSGIVDRLVKQGMIKRQAHSTDRRVTVLVVSQPVREFLDTQMATLALHPLLEALSTASPEELNSMSNGLDTLVRLLSRTSPEEEEETSLPCA
ncbi:MarR family winged helix-turn-helix transcriptional regulator [Tunturiibacter psychrotolerans]|uniref:MarR family winged helix-turn-helix transcriptional regulator n=1 Tax=Tunturiibacter psychrotolerans TaxID=3069686 RepID=UPI003D1EB6AF